MQDFKCPWTAPYAHNIKQSSLPNNQWFPLWLVNVSDWQCHVGVQKKTEVKYNANNITNTD
jgi:hypothetical protein